MDDPSQMSSQRILGAASSVAAISFMYRLIGIAAVATGFGAAMGLAFWGYSQTQVHGSSADMVAETLSRALSRTPLVVSLDKNATLHLDTRDVTVRLDPHAKVGVTGAVGLDPNSKVAVTGTVGLDPNAAIRLQEAVPQRLNTQRPQALGPVTDRGGNPIATKFTVFKSVPYPGGVVTTGYEFVPGSDVPDNEFCYFAPRTDGGAQTNIWLARNQKYTNPTRTPPSFNARDAASYCVWFDNSPTRM